MNKDKQLEEMRHLADEMGKAISTQYEKRVLTDERKLEAVLIANGWRKASDIAREIFEEIESIVDELTPFDGYIYALLLKRKIAKLKEKCEEGEG
jgi:hypothetical protein